MYVEFDDMRGEVRAAGARAPLTSAGQAGEVLVGGAGGPVLRPVTFAERSAAAASALAAADPTGALCAALRTRATVRAGRLDAELLDLVVLGLAGAEAEDASSFAATAAAVVRATGGRLDSVLAAPARDVDRLAGPASAAPDDGWTRVTFSPAAAPGELREHLARLLLRRAAADAPAAGETSAGRVATGKGDATAANAAVPAAPRDAWDDLGSRGGRSPGAEAASGPRVPATAAGVGAPDEVAAHARAAAEEVAARAAAAADRMAAHAVPAALGQIARHEPPAPDATARHEPPAPDATARHEPLAPDAIARHTPPALDEVARATADEIAAHGSSGAAHGVAAARAAFGGSALPESDERLVPGGLRPSPAGTLPRLLAPEAKPGPAWSVATLAAVPALTTRRAWRATGAPGPVGPIRHGAVPAPRGRDDRIELDVADTLARALHDEADLRGLDR